MAHKVTVTSSLDIPAQEDVGYQNRSPPFQWVYEKTSHTGSGGQAYNAEALRAAVTAALEGVLPPKEATWGRIKTLFEKDLPQSYPADR